MDPNFSFNPNLNPSSYYYGNNYPRPQSHHQLQPQPQPQPQQYQQAQAPPSYYPQPYQQSLPQNYSQHYYNQDQSYQQAQFQHFEQPFYHPPIPTAQPQPPSQSQSGFQVVIPPHPRQSPPSHDQQRQYRLQPDYQPYSQVQVQIPPPSFQPPSKQHHPQPGANLQTQPQANVIIEVPKPNMARDKAIPPKPAQKGQSRVLQTVEVNTKPKQPATKAPDPGDSPIEPDEPEPEYPSLLCVLADDYLEIARKLPALTEDYYTLIATALGCLESVLNNFKLPPLREAQVSLRYAQVVYQETENHDEAETILTKSIELCERHKFVDLKYEMQLLLSKVLYESKPKAALRDIQRMIDDIEAYRHVAWLYVFRFQHAMFSLASSAPGEVHSATVQLEKITNLARQNSDSAVLAFAAILEALFHLSSSSHEAITSTRSALAKARALQLNPDVESSPQMTILMEFIDFACSVQESNIAQTESKRKAMHDVLYQSIAHANWRDDGSIYIPVAKRAIANIQLQANGHVIERNGKYFIPFSWLGKEEIEALGFLFSADSVAYKNGADGGKAEKFAETGLALVRSWGQPTLVTGYRQSQRGTIFRKLLEAQFLLLLAFMRCSGGLWQAANETLTDAHAISEAVGDAFPINMKYCLLYLRGVILQGTGNLTAALQIYQSPMFSLGPQQSSPSHVSKASNRITSSYHADSDITRNFCILAAMNSAFIIQNAGHPQFKRLSSLISSLDAAVQSSGNKYIQAHFSLLVSVLSTTTLTVKQYLRSAMEAGKAIGSAQTTALALIYMHEKLFKGVVDEQAMKCAKAASYQVKRWGDPMWSHVVAGLEAQSLEINGMIEGAQQRKADADAAWSKLPEDVRRMKGG